MIGDEDEHRLGIGGTEVVFEGRELLFFRATRIEGFQVSDEDDLEGSHQRRRSGEVEYMENTGLGQIGDR